MFNVVLALCRDAGRSVTSLSAEECSDALDRMPLDVRDVVLKSHSLDQRLLRIARLARARIILSTRDPRDSVVSQGERFGTPIGQAAAELSKAFATIASLSSDQPTLRFAYEDRFTEKVQTIASIARFLDLPVRHRAMARIHADLTPATVRLRIADRLRMLAPDEVAAHDPATQWHPNHVGDGQIGKWREKMDPCTRDVVDGCLSLLSSAGHWRDHPLRWSAELFNYTGGEQPRPTVELKVGRDVDFLAYGPYLHLPAGRWRATPLIRLAESSDRVELEADVYLNWMDFRLAHKFGIVTADGADALTMDFGHFDHFQPVEVRLRGVTRGHERILFSGWRISWLGELRP